TPVLSLSHEIAIQHVTPGSLSQGDIDEDCANMLKVIELYQDQFSHRQLRGWRASVYRRAAAVHLAAGRNSLARPAALSRLRLAPLEAEAWWILMRTMLP